MPPLGNTRRKSGPPDFLIIGSQRCGTTWLTSRLRRQPGVFISPRKELHYFDASRFYPTSPLLDCKRVIYRMITDSGQRIEFIRNFVWEMRRSPSRLKSVVWLGRFLFGRISDCWYRSLFPRDASKMRGEASPGYCLLTVRDMEWMKSINPDVRLILILRNPIERIWSQLRFTQSRGWELHSDEPEDAYYWIDSYAPRLRTDYEFMLQKLEKVFSKDQILVLFHDELKEDSEAFEKKVFDFLEIEPKRNPKERGNRNAAPPADIPPLIRRRLAELWAERLKPLEERFGGYVTRWREEMEQTLRDVPEQPVPPRVPPAVSKADSPLGHPDFVFAGGKTSGADELAKALSRQPQVWMMPLQNIDYFSWKHQRPWKLLYRAFRRAREDRSLSIPQQLRWTARFARHFSSLEWYQALYPEDSTRLRGERLGENQGVLVTEIKELAVMNPALKSIFILRDPIDAVWVRVKGCVKAGMFHDPSDEEALEMFAGAQYIDMPSDYNLILDRYEDLFSPEQVLVLFYEDLRDRPEEVFRQTAEFLTIDPQDRVPRITAPGPVERPPKWIEEKLAERWLPMLRELEARYGGHVTSWRERAERVLAEKGKRGE